MQRPRRTVPVKSQGSVQGEVSCVAPANFRRSPKWFNILSPADPFQRAGPPLWQNLRPHHGVQLSRPATRFVR